MTVAVEWLLVGQLKSECQGEQTEGYKTPLSCDEGNINLATTQATQGKVQNKVSCIVVEVATREWT